MSERWKDIGDRICIEYLKYPLLYKLLGLTTMAAVAVLAGNVSEVQAQAACGQGWELESVAQLGQGAQALVMEVPVGPERYGVFDNLWCAVEQARQLRIKLPSADDGAMVAQIIDGLGSFSRQAERILLRDGNGTLFVRSAAELDLAVGDQVRVLLPISMGNGAQPVVETMSAAAVTGANGLVEFPSWVQELKTASYYISGGLIGVSALIFGAMRLMMGPTIPQSSARPSSSPAPRTYVSPEDRVEQEALRNWHQRNKDYTQQSEEDKKAYVGRLIANGRPRDEAESEFYRVSQGMPARDSLDGGVPGGGASGITASDSLFEVLEGLVDRNRDEPLEEKPGQSGWGKSDIKPPHPGHWIEGDYQVRDVDSPPDAGDEG